MAAFDPATLDRWRALPILDREGATVGTIGDFYLDRETGHPTWALVETGLFGAALIFVPLVHATELDNGLQVPYDKRHIKDAPRINPHDELTPDEEATLFTHYGVDYQPLTNGDAEASPQDSALEQPERPPGTQETVPPDPGPVSPGGPPVLIPADPGSAGPAGPPESLSADPGSVAAAEVPETVAAGPGPAETSRTVPADPGSIKPASAPGSEPADPDSAGPPGSPTATATEPGLEFAEPPAPEPEFAGSPSPAHRESAFAEPPGPVPAQAPTTRSGPAGAGPADPGDSTPPSGASTSDEATGVTDAVPPAPSTIDPAEASQSVPDGTASGPDQKSHEPADVEPVEPAAATDRLDPTGTGPTRDAAAPGQFGEPTHAEPDLSRPAPVEPGLPGSTSATSSEFGPSKAPVEGDARTDPPPEPMDAPRAPDESTWPSGTRTASEEPDPADHPTGTSDRWREATLAADRDQTARAAPPPRNERSPLGRAMRRLERLVGGGQPPADQQDVSQEDRDTIDRPRDSNEEDPHGR